MSTSTPASTLPATTWPDAVLFDCDGTLADTEPLSDRAWAEVLVRYGDAAAPQEARFPLDDLAAAAEFQRILADERVLTLHSQETTLEDVFVQVTGRTLT